jgi:hypothetical protein
MVSPPAGGGDARRRQEGESDGHAMPPSDWNALTDDIQLALSREAMRRAAETLAEHAELPVAEIEHGGLSDRGGPDALRLFAAVVRATQQDPFGPVGRA